VFGLKKFVSFWLMPLPLCLALLVSGLVLSLSPRRQKAGRALLVLAAALLLLFSNKAVSNGLLRPLEGRYPAVPEVAAGAPAPASIAGCRIVAVLGGGHTDMPALPATGQLSSSALARIVEGARLLRILPGARLVVSGPGEPGRPSHAAVLARAAESLGIDPSRITLIDTALDTEDESLAFARLAGSSRVALVTSAWHMPRAAALFQRTGVDFIPCPADFVARGSLRFHWADLACDSESLERSTLAVHEWVGLLWLRVRGAARGAFSPQP
jgi:uncharacterized SAM-binding protein YcdF (DUF218 family)